MNFVNKHLSTVIFSFGFLIAIVLFFVFPLQNSIFLLIIVSFILFLAERLGWNSSVVSILKRILAIGLFVCSCFTTLVNLVLFSSDYTVEDKFFSGILLLIFNVLSFLIARWFWDTSKMSIPVDIIEISDSTIGDSITDGSKPSTALKSLLNLLMLKRTSTILAIVSGIVTVYVYFNPYKLALSKLGQPVPFLGAMCTATAYFLKDPGLCRFIGTPIINSLHNYAVEEDISFWQNWLFLLAVVFCITLIGAFLPVKTEEASINK